MIYGNSEGIDFHNHTVQKLFEEVTYANDFYFTFGNEFNHIHLNPGFNNIESGNNKTAQVEFKRIPTEISGTCHLVQYKAFGPRSLKDVDEQWGTIIIGYNKPLNPMDIPKHFRIYFTPLNGWHSTIFDS